MKKDRLLSSILIPGLLVGLALCLPYPVFSQEPAKERIRVRATADRDYPPHSFIDKNGEAAGFDIDVMNEISKRLNLSIDYNLAPWHAAIVDLKEGRADLLLGTVYTEERDREMELSIPVLIKSYVIFSGKQKAFASINDLYHGSITVLKDDVVLSQFIVPMELEQNTQGTATIEEAFRLLDTGKTDYVLAPYSVGIDIINREKMKNIKVVGSPLMPSYYTIAVKKGNRDLLARINRAIDDMKSDGTMKIIADRWVVQREELTLKKIARISALFAAPIIAVIILLLFWNWSLKKQVLKKTDELQKSEARFLSVAGNVPGIVYRSRDDRSMTMEFISRGVKDLTGYDEADFLNSRVRSFADILSPEDREKAIALRQGTFIQEYRIIDRKGEIRWVQEQGHMIPGNAGEPAYVDGVIIDITERKKLEAELEFFATMDTATGVYNRRYGLDQLNRFAILSRRTGANLSVCYIDVNSLKHVNDTFGHQEGDFLINSIVDCAKNSLRDSDLMCRLGGDEFLIILPHTPSSEAENLWQRILERISTINGTIDKPFKLSASHGITELQLDSKETIEELLVRADEIMYHEKQEIKKREGNPNGR